MTLREHIAKALMHSRIGLTRKELGEAIAADIYNNDLNRISDQLFHLQKANHVEKHSNFIANGNRWTITAKGRAFYSDLNDDETHDQTQPAETNTVSPVSVDHREESESAAQNSDRQLLSDLRMVLDSIQQQMGCMETPVAQTPDDQPIQINEGAHATLTYDPFAELCIAIHTAQDMLNRLKKPPVLSNKSEKLQLLNFIRSHYKLINTDISTVLTHIIEDLEKLEAA